MEARKTLAQVQSETFAAMCDCLDVHGMCCVERPTGFGKTKLFMDYAKKYPHSKLLYIYDVTSAKSDIENKYHPTNIEFLSYAAISREMSAQQVKQYICGQPWHTIIFDEAHLMGGENIKKLLMDILPLAIKAGVRILGGTATKLRTDLVDVSKAFFHEHGVPEYTMLDAVEDGIMLAPTWALTAHYDSLLRSLHEVAGRNPNSYVKTALSQMDKAYADLDGVCTVYHDTVKAVYGKVPNNMRFIIFYPTVKAIDDNINRDVQEFQKAFPQHQVVYAAISTGDGHMRTITEVENLFTSGGKQVQLIFAVDMLNQSYHSDLLTGIVMYRASFSNIIFTQQLGRIMSVTAKTPGIVFDNVGNVLQRPDRSMAALQLMLLDQTKAPSNTPVSKGHIELRLRATQEFIDFQKVYERILATSKITQEQIDYAKYLMHQLKAPVEIVTKGLGITADVARELVT